MLAGGTEPTGKLTMGNIYKLTLRVWFVILVGVVFTTEPFVRLLYVLFRCRPVHCLTRPKSGILLLSVASCIIYAQSRTLYRSAALMSTAHASSATKIRSEWIAI